MTPEMFAVLSSIDTSSRSLVRSALPGAPVLTDQPPHHHLTGAVRRLYAMASSRARRRHYPLIGTAVRSS